MKGMTYAVCSAALVSYNDLRNNTEEKVLCLSIKPKGDYLSKKFTITIFRDEEMNMMFAPYTHVKDGGTLPNDQLPDWNKAKANGVPVEFEHGIVMNLPLGQPMYALDRDGNKVLNFKTQEPIVVTHAKVFGIILGEEKDGTTVWNADWDPYVQLEAMKATRFQPVESSISTADPADFVATQTAQPTGNQAVTQPTQGVAQGAVQGVAQGVAQGNPPAQPATVAAAAAAF